MSYITYKYNISKIQCYLDKHSLTCIVHAFETCRLDYGNALLCGYHGSKIHKLQRIQNFSAHLISGPRTYNHITPVLKDLHWLPVVQRIQFKVVITVCVHKTMHNTAPAYFQELIVHMPHLEACAPESTTCCVCHSHDRPWQAAERPASQSPSYGMHCHSICATFRTYPLLRNKDAPVSSALWTSVTIYLRIIPFLAVCGSFDIF